MEPKPNVLQVISRKVLEDWAFMLVDDPTEPAHFNDATPLYAATMEFHGAINGRVWILAQSEFLTALVDNLLGGGEEAEAKDAFGEMLNVLIGNFLTEAYGPDIPFALLPPSVSVVDGEERNALTTGPRVFWLIADEHPIAVTFTIDV